jgi:hypothetical protein
MDLASATWLDWFIVREAPEMYRLEHVISALEAFCRDHGETIEEREQRLGAQAAPLRDNLAAAGDPVINRNIRLALHQLQIDSNEFFPYLEGKP